MNGTTLPLLRQQICWDLGALVDYALLTVFGPWNLCVVVVQQRTGELLAAQQGGQISLLVAQVDICGRHKDFTNPYEPILIKVQKPWLSSKWN